MGELQCSGPAATVPSIPSMGSPVVGSSSSESRSWRVWRAERGARGGTGASVEGRGWAPGGGGFVGPELQDLGGERGAAAGEGRGGVVLERERLAGLAREVDHHVVALGRPHQQVREVHRLGEEPLVGADLVEEQRLLRVPAVWGGRGEEAGVAG